MCVEVEELVPEAEEEGKRVGLLEQDLQGCREEILTLRQEKEDMERNVSEFFVGCHTHWPRPPVYIGHTFQYTDHTLPVCRDIVALPHSDFCSSCFTVCVCVCVCMCVCVCVCVLCSVGGPDLRATGRHCSCCAGTERGRAAELRLQTTARHPQRHPDLHAGVCGGVG